MRTSIRSPRLWLGVAVSVAAVYWAVQGISWPLLFEHLAEADYKWIVPSAIVVVVGQFARSFRWIVLFGKGPRPGYWPAFHFLNVGYFVSGVFPFRLGDFVRAWLVDDRTPAGGPEAFATVMVERATDFLMVITLLALWVPRPAAVLLDDQLGPGMWSDPTNLTVIAVALVIVVYVGLWVVSSLGPRLAEAVVKVLGAVGLPDHVADRIGRLVGDFSAGFAPLRSPRTALIAVGWTLVVWLLGALSTWLMMFAFDMSLPYSVALFAICATALFAVLPSSPGYVGVFHTAIILALSLSSVPKETALAYAIVLHGMTMVVLIVLGVVSISYLGLSRRDLTEHMQTG